MCGIAGIVRLSPTADIAADHLRVMANQLTHRGPDDEGLRLDPEGRCGFGFRRLAIIDIAGGHQPLSNEDGTVWAVCNGEIYNFRELRQTLEQRGHRFATASDAEVIVHAYEEHGLQCFEHLAGMFAIAIWDQTAGRLVLARDRLGKKPLTYAVFNDRLYFASEAKAISRCATSRAKSTRNHCTATCSSNTPPRIRSSAASTSCRPAHHSHRCRQQHVASPPPTGAYHSRHPLTEHTPTPSPAGELLTAAVRKRLIADVPLGRSFPAA
jgi:asparagine synthase (glutamine-hydrolysing)